MAARDKRERDPAPETVAAALAAPLSVPAMAMAHQLIANDRDVALGAADAIAGLAVVLVNVGIVSREQVAAIMQELLRQQQALDGDGRPMTRLVLEKLHRYFSAPVFDGKPN